MNRRDFLFQTIPAALATAATTSFIAYVDDNDHASPGEVYDRNLQEWGQSLKQHIIENSLSGDDFDFASLDPEENGFRWATIHLKNGRKISWRQPWSH